MLTIVQHLGTPEVRRPEKKAAILSTMCWGEARKNICCLYEGACRRGGCGHSWLAQKRLTQEQSSFFAHSAKVGCHPWDEKPRFRIAFPLAALFGFGAKIKPFGELLDPLLAFIQVGHAWVHRSIKVFTERETRQTIEPATTMAGVRSDIDQAALRFAATQEAALCTIVGIEGSFSRRLGAQFAVGDDGSCVGSLSDGCLEAELSTQARLARADGQPRLLRYGHGSPFVDFRLPCGAGIDILVDPSPNQPALAKIVAALDARQVASLSLPVTGADLLGQRVYLPSCRLIALGSGAELAGLQALAGAFGVDVAVRSPNMGLAMGCAPQNLSVDAWTAVVLLFHDHDWEAAILDWALDSPAFYLGAIGGHQTRTARVNALRQKGFAAAAIARMRSPIGLIPNARDPRTLALSVLADVVQAYEALRG